MSQINHLFFSAVTIGFAYKSFNGTEGDTNNLQICAVMVTGALERSIPVYVTTQTPGSTATGNVIIMPMSCITSCFCSYQIKSV